MFYFCAKQATIFFILLFVYFPFILIAQEFGWAKRIGYPAVYSGYNGTTTVDKDENIYVAGYSYGNNTFEINNSKVAVKYTEDGFFFIKYDSTGKVIWLRDIADHIDDFNGGSGAQLLSSTIDNSGNLWITGYYRYGIVFKGIARRDTFYTEAAIEEFFIAKYDSQGELLWAKSAGGRGYQRGVQLAVDEHGNCYVAGHYQSQMKFSDSFTLPPPTHLNACMFLAKYNSDGTLLWAKRVEGIEYYHFLELAIDTQGNPYVSSTYSGRMIYGGMDGEKETTLSINMSYNTFLAKFNKSGNVEWVKTIGSGKDYTESSGINGLEADYEGNIYVAGYHGAAVSFQRVGVADTTLAANTHFIGKYSSEGQLHWVTGFVTDGNFQTELALNHANKVYIIAVFKDKLIFNKNRVNQLTLTANGFLQIAIAGFENDGKFIGVHKVVSNGHLFAQSIAVGNTGKIYFTGQISGKEGVEFGNISLPSDTARGENDLTNFICSLKRVEYTGSYNSLRGTVFANENSSCEKDSQERGIDKIFLKAEPGHYYTSTDSLGNYAFYFPKGSYTISQILPSDTAIRKFIQECPVAPTSYIVNFTSYGKDTSGFDFANQVIYKPYLTIDVASDRRRRCFKSTTTVHYRNDGYAKAENVQVKVFMPAYVVPISASIPWSNKIDSLLIFNIGTLEAGASKTITIIDSVICGNESIRGLTQCTKAIITPFNESKIDPAWDQSYINLRAVCKENGFVRLSIKNTGTGHMADSAAYRIYLDAVQVFSANYKLQSGDSLILQVPVNGKTIRLEADLTAPHPYKGQPIVTLEGCGSGANVKISKGYVDLLPQDDSGEEVEVSCMPILDSYDPNDKMASPAGVSHDHIITAADELEYMIRFQNTGSDMAYNITIEDTLNEDLDIATLQIGASSHPCTWKITGEGLPKIIWTFRDINLPDSTSNEAKSHGFVKFKISQKKENPIGTLIKNKADIYFDYNSAITTNETLHTIGVLPFTTEKIVVDNCGNDPSIAQAGEDMLIQEVNSVDLQAIAPSRGAGRWQVVKGSGKIVSPFNPITLVTDLAIGETVLEWSVSLCDKVSKDSIRIERAVIPAMPIVNNPAPYCASEPIAAITAVGQQISWYNDAARKEKIAEGNSYQPLLTRTDTFYVTQSVSGYESLAKRVIVRIKPTPQAPQVDAAGYICEGKLLSPLIASGEHIVWYSDESLKRKIAEGNTFRHPVVTGDLYVTQQVEGCRSSATKVTFRPRGVEYDKMYVSNVITPNGDDKNDTFTGPQFPEGSCIGNFLRIVIYNRWGKQVYESSDANFSWQATQVASGVYFYSIQYSNFSYRGSISILR
ncbi:gliding motility-associated C-terminal domain-containing protein [Rhodocytophaga aerolata]|uniref:Gliding motility-associated C-terminal domain-containing protein n=1 Tax=Rhodocytophaga aerolata TaxID=455078 RepID=A0ABT8RGK8_9BACT|nr:gliding motility-associated C-terminal domain-containing protein [Rhodocytophaga aerolata]MDO1451232.1 gliding motility-associated C-terminal domain-containing protein [Rhodocytophaga aerolata]